MKKNRNDLKNMIFFQKTINYFECRLVMAGNSDGSLWKFDTLIIGKAMKNYQFAIEQFFIA